MPGPLLFVIFLFVVDILIKSSRDKKKIEQAKVKKAQDLYDIQNKRPNKQVSVEKPKTLQDLRKNLEEEIRKERQREIDRRKKLEEARRAQANKTPIIEKPKIREVDIPQKKQDSPLEEVATNPKLEGLKEDLLRGIIFSEILAEPKALRKRNL